MIDLPYGPFGETANAAILKARGGGGLDDLALAELTDPITPMVPLLLAVHPSFSAARLLPRAAEILPGENDQGQLRNCYSCGMVQSPVIAANTPARGPANPQRDRLVAAVSISL